MLEGLSREIRKLEVRLEDYSKEENEFVKELRKCLSKFTELNNGLERLKMSDKPQNNEELIMLRLEAVKALSEALKRESMVEHEKSHLLESYGTLILSLEEEFKKLRL